MGSMIIYLVQGASQGLQRGPLQPKWAIPKGVYDHKPGLRGFSRASEGPLNLN